MSNTIIKEDVLVTIDILTNFIQKLFVNIKEEETFNIVSDISKTINNKFIILNNTKKNISDFPNNCIKIFNPFVSNIYRNSIDDYDTSLIKSVLFCITGEMKNQIFISNLKDKMIADLTEQKLHMKFKYREFKWTIRDISDGIKNNINDKMFVRYLADYLNINIFIINIAEDKIFVVFNETELNIHKPTIFLSLYNNIFEPISYENKFIWNNTIAFNKVLTDKQLLYVMNNTIINTHESLIINNQENLDKYLCN